MAFNIADVTVPVAVIMVTALLFLVNYSLYRKTKRGSYAFMCWAIASASYLMGSVFYLSGVLITHDPNNLMINLADHVLFGMLSGFFVLLGVVFLGANTTVFDYDEEELRSLQIPFIVVSFAAFFLVLTPVYMGLATSETVMFVAMFAGACMQLILWSAASLMFFPVYKAVRKGTRAWLLIYMSVISIAIASLAEFLSLMGYAAFDGIYVMAGVSFIIFLISGFLLLERSMKPG